MLCAYVKIVREIIIMEMHLIEAFLRICSQHVVQELLLFVEFEKLFLFQILLEFLNLFSKHLNNSFKKSHWNGEINLGGWIGKFSILFVNRLFSS